MHTFDVVVAADLSAANGTTAAPVDAIKVLLRARYRVGLVHVGTDAKAAFTGNVRAVLHNESADHVLSSDDVDSRLLVVCSPEAFAAGSPPLPTISAGQAVIIVGESRAARLPRATIEAMITETVGVKPSWAQWEPTAFGKHVEQLIGEAEQGPAGPTSDALVEERRSGVLIIDLTGSDRPDTLLPAVRRETTDPDSPRVVATSAEHAAEHAGDLAVETFPRDVGEMSPDRRAKYLADRVIGLLRSHQPQSLFVLDNGSAGFDVAEVMEPDVDQAWRVVPGADGGGDDLDDLLAQRVDSVLPPGWSVVPLATPTTPDDGGASFVSAVMLRLRRWLAALRFGFARWSLQSGTLVVAPQLHSNPEQAVRALRQMQVEAGGLNVTLLAPPDWEPAAAKHSIPIETLIPEPTWHTIYGSGWTDYVSERIREVRTARNTASVVFAEDFAPSSTALHALGGLARPARR